ncbi:nucleoid occlusion factor SlmA [Zwartia panacis]|jgi:TetR/AcrR family transcriptional regulator|uniref:nucleoid occlusion factor SlmA n=1 Tax=Zwartia panacis TaxID=2683345 RepID=UPI0025B424F7|nr:nucleoid occlusion factor SlmA [Zwartia panacis]MDN4017222.1 nucleoid occlusion factor SlmA [Zwartia panacis]
MSVKTGERKHQILQTLAEMLEQPRAARITTAALAAKMQLSEAALYRHFASKAQMFEGLFEFIESTIFTLVNQIVSTEPDGVEQARKIAVMLVTFAERNKGMTRVLSGDALVTEDERLQGRVTQITDRIEAVFKQALRHAVMNGALNPAVEVTPLAAALTHIVLGSWLRFAQSGWQVSPTLHIHAQLKLLLDQRH